MVNFNVQTEHSRLLRTITIKRAFFFVRTGKDMKTWLAALGSVAVDGCCEVSPLLRLKLDFLPLDWTPPTFDQRRQVYDAARPLDHVE